METDTIVVGQGIAGSLVAFMLHLNKIPFMVIDPCEGVSPSRIAAGMFSPVSGKRKTIQPMVPEQISFATRAYTDISEFLKIDILHLQNIYQVHHSFDEMLDATAKLRGADFEPYLENDSSNLPNIKQPFGAVGITHSGWVDCPLWIDAFACWLQAQDLLIKSAFLYNQLRINPYGMEYNGIKFKHIVFCEGYQANKNPFFQNEKIIPCKGDMLTVACGLDAGGYIVKRDGAYLVSTGQNIFKAGATYQWNNDRLQPDKADRRIIEAKLDTMLDIGYTVINHQSAIRSTTKNREVIANQHPDYPGMYFLNGLGTRGVLQGPWYANQIVSMIQHSRIST
ncbi:MAG: FAD-binding oxidoreductase [Ferruginibacter sp.]